MKKYFNFLTAALFIGLTVLSSCGSDDGGGNGEKELDYSLLNGTYNAIAPITVPSGSSSTADDWADFTITVTGSSATGGSFTTTGGPTDTAFDVVWPAQDSYSIKTAALPSIVFVRESDGVEMAIEVDANDRIGEISFAVSGSSNARTNVVDGSYVFTVEPAQ
ncbi:hypothetical protein [Reichenbachiella ulvae]|uniref:Lipocalin-like domain-containing protein n=1 Tax=Reichenbachiella ulvae TaxID=2980104 RepID=A0ABT3CZR0_9BACT|nr:hypothetical protein [Reichenbachiella ulvae]MCV9389172.1 hypothetical protein [Reichenbachiella ulvae]